MALSGSFTGTTSNRYILPKITWSSKPSVVNNYSDVTVTLSYSRTNTGFTTEGTWQGSITVDGITNRSSKHIVITYNSNTVAMSATVRVYHDVGGQKSIHISCVGVIPQTTLSDTICSATVTLDTILRASSISCTTANIESNPTITISRAHPSLTHTITYEFGSLRGKIASETSATSITSWTIPASFYGQIPNDKNGWGTLLCTTYDGKTTIGTSSCRFTVTTDEAKCKPTVSGAVVDTNAATVALTGDNNTLVRYCSTALCTITATLNKSAGSIKSKTINNVSVSGDTLTIANVETGVFDFWAKDSRGYPGTDKEVKTLVLYEKLTNNATIQRTDPTSGKATLILEGNYFSGSFGATSNALTVKYRQGSGSYVTVTPKISGNKYTATVPLSGLDYTESFTYEVIVSDKINTVTKKLTLHKGIPVFDWGESDFAFNVPVTIDGTLTIGGQTITESQLASLLALIE